MVELEKGDKVTWISGVEIYRGVVSGIFEIDSPRYYPVKIDFDNGRVKYFTLDGKEYKIDEKRSLFHGHNITVKIEGEEVPERDTKSQ